MSGGLLRFAWFAMQPDGRYPVAGAGHFRMSVI